MCFHCCWVWFLSSLHLETVLYVLLGKAFPLAMFPITVSMWNSRVTRTSWPCWDSPTKSLECLQQEAQGQIILVTRTDKRKALWFKKSLLDIGETSWVSNWLRELGRFFKDTLVVYNQGTGNYRRIPSCGSAVRCLEITGVLGSEWACKVRKLMNL